MFPAQIVAMPETRKIVVLEDDRSTCALIASVLEKAGYIVFQTYEGRAAIEAVFKERPSLFISDVLVPDMNGSEVVKTLNKSEFGAQLETLFLTSLLGKGDADITEKKLKVEGKEYPALAKPLKPKLLLKIVTRLAGEPIVSDPVRKEIEESVEAQEEEATKAIESEETGGEASDKESESDGEKPVEASTE
jgi:CheY-like chemotaxis protein